MLHLQKEVVHVRFSCGFARFNKSWRIQSHGGSYPSLAATHL